MRLSPRARSIEVPNIRVGVTHLRHGGLLIYPTETAYAIGCDATNARAVRAIFRLKGRERGKPLPLIAASVAMAKRYARFTPLARRLARRWWPGALTIVLPQLRHSEGRARGISHHDKVAALAPGALARDGTLALRISSHPIARALSQRLGRPIISTSANRSGQPPCHTTHSVLHSLKVSNGAKEEVTYLTRGRVRNMSRPGIGEKISGVRRMASSVERSMLLRILDTGPLHHRPPSTIVDARGDRPIVLRHGTIRLE